MQITLDAKRHRPIEEGETVRFRVADVDRGRVDHPYHLAVVTRAEGGGFYRLGNKQGRFKQCFSRAEIEPVNSNFIHTSDVPNNDTTVRASVRETSLGAGQGHVRCNCRRKCGTNTCRCRKAAVLCNSKCHVDLACTNK